MMQEREGEDRPEGPESERCELPGRQHEELGGSTEAALRVRDVLLIEIAADVTDPGEE
jgi:hypothetical protein